MTLPENPRPRKPRRLGLYAPFAVLLAAIGAWTLGWSWMRDAVFRQMDAAARHAGETGYRADWTGRSMSGFPFRLDLDIVSPRIREASGWGLSAPRLKAEAFVFSPDHWVIVAPAGVTLNRRVGGPVVVAAKALRASLSAAEAHPPRFSVEGVDLTFAAGAGAAPVAVTGAESLHIHAKAGPADQGAFYLALGGARTAGPGLLNQIAVSGPVTLTADAIFSHAGALRAWRGAGGRLTIRQLGLSAGAITAEARSGVLSIDPAGRLEGALDMTLTSAPRLLALVAERTAMTPQAERAAGAVIAAHARGQTIAVTVDFQAGQTTLGPVAIGPAPRVY